MNTILYSYAVMGGNRLLVLKGDGTVYDLSLFRKKRYAKLGKIPVEKAGELFASFSNKEFNELKQNYNNNEAKDLGSEYVAVIVNGKKKKVRDYGQSAPQNFRRGVDGLLKAVENLRLVKPEEKTFFYNGLRENIINSELFGDTVERFNWDFFKKDIFDLIDTQKNPKKSAARAPAKKTSQKHR